MKTIKLREFQRNVCALIKGKEPLQVCDGNGEIVGSWVPGCPTSVRQASESKNPVFSLGSLKAGREALSTPVRHVEVSQIMGVGMIVDGEPIELCAKCEKIEPSYEGIYFNEGEEIFMKICSLCWKQHKPQGFKRIKK